MISEKLGNHKPEHFAVNRSNVGRRMLLCGLETDAVAWVQDIDLIFDIDTQFSGQNITEFITTGIGRMVFWEIDSGTVGFKDVIVYAKTIDTSGRELITGKSS